MLLMALFHNIMKHLLHYMLLYSTKAKKKICMVQVTQPTLNFYCLT